MRNGWRKKVLPVLVLLGMIAGCASDVQPTEITIVSEIAGIKERDGANIPVEATVQQMEAEGQQQITDMSDAYETILKGVTREFIAGYPVNESFLMWINAVYGNQMIERIAQESESNVQDTNLWYECTGKSIHVLWLDYCRECGFERYRLDNVYWMESGSEEEAVFSFIGDINFDEDWCTMQKYRDEGSDLTKCISGDLLQLLNESDIMVANNEFVYADGGTPLAGKAYTFAADMQKVSLLHELGTDLASLGNNHVYDYGEEGLLSTLETLRGAGIPYVGAGENLDEAEKIVYFVINGKKIAIVSATEIERSTNFTKEATEHSAGVLKMLHPEKYLSVIEEADRTSDYVIAIAHWGTEGQVYFDAEETDYASQLVEAGADAVIGGHPHRMQGASFINGAPVAYSLGNFWFSTGSLYTTVAQIVIDRSGELRMRYVPCIQENRTTRLLTEDAEKAEFYEYLAAISNQVLIDDAGYFYDRNADVTNEAAVLYDSESEKYRNVWISGGKDLDGNPIDIVGNLK